MTRLLASVKNLDEALVAAASGADIIDLKAPDRGSLGALPSDVIEAIVSRLHGSQPISATIGDLPLEPMPVVAATRAIAGTGVDYVKIGFFPGGDERGTVAALEPLTHAGARLVAVLFGDCNPDLGLPARLATAGFAGCMLDTADKTRGSLTQLCSLSFLDHFVTEVRQQGLFCGLAGSLRAEDIPDLVPLEPDYLGFRGALCRGHRRTQSLDALLLHQIGCAVRSARAQSASSRPPAQSAPAALSSDERQSPSLLSTLEPLTR